MTTKSLGAGGRIHGLGPILPIGSPPSALSPRFQRMVAVTSSLGDADDRVGDDEVPPVVLDPYASPTGHESEPDPDFFPQENSFYWAEYRRRQAGRPPTELFRVEMTTEFSVTDIDTFSRWAIKNADTARDLRFMEGEGENGEDVLVASFDSDYYAIDDAWDLAGAALLILEGWAPPGSAIQSSAWNLYLADEPDETSQVESSAFVVTMKANVGVFDLDELQRWLQDELGDVELGADRSANGLSQAGEALRLATDKVLPRLAPPGIELHAGEWSVAEMDDDTPETWE